ncbi:hypothetical protein J2X46_002643 [Nocardioides sp. BE266]|uniref:hypothetical protein n=1 Tax=Nocardioides sp. BE266 TaxID=2817725 RepID=UPI00285CD8D8|nr:hypothetical protein [Nocardioides sp. BE266]MDR7253653.1 hypothetical protein [Nocardioides sp. BE266]
MNTTELPLRPDVAAFVARVRECLADLSEEDRLELTEGLEADLTDQVAEHDGGVLGDPEAYARELRTAAGFEPVARRRTRLRADVSLAERVEDLTRRWEELIAHRRVAPVWHLLVALRPAWWVVRAWAAAVVVARLVPGWYPYGLTWLPGVPVGVGLALLAACIVGSALVGMGRLWPGGTSSVLARTTLLLLNVAAVVAVPVINGQLDRLSWDRYSQGYNEAQWGGNEQGLLNRGQQVCNIAAYDAEGQPLEGVQLFDQAGRPLDVRCYDQQATKVPWVLGDVTRWNVFPLGERDRPARNATRRADLSDAAFPTPDRATTPEVTNPLVPEEVEPVKEPTGRKGRAKDGAERDGKGDEKGDGVSRR